MKTDQNNSLEHYLPLMRHFIREKATDTDIKDALLYNWWRQEKPEFLSMTEWEAMRLALAEFEAVGSHTCKDPRLPRISKPDRVYVRDLQQRMEPVLAEIKVRYSAA